MGDESWPEFKKKVAAALEERKALRPCPRCGHEGFTMVDGLFNQPLQKELGGLVIGGPAVPSVVIACTNCGFLSQHALGMLGLLQKGSKQ